MTNPETQWREAYEAWLAEVQFDRDSSGHALRGFRAGYLAASPKRLEVEEVAAIIADRVFHGFPGPVEQEASRAILALFGVE